MWLVSVNFWLSSIDSNFQSHWQWCKYQRLVSYQNYILCCGITTTGEQDKVGGGHNPPPLPPKWRLWLEFCLGREIVYLYGRQAEGDKCGRGCCPYHAQCEKFFFCQPLLQVLGRGVKRERALSPSRVRDCTQNSCDMVSTYM